ncbi:similar to RIKEN cDNA 0610037L13, isoform CRA_d [Rattus norvegicus]|uniref:Similar to RIKEN cDNA 0610037L13, isoform CRA_d n=1 Tax=Rattus norvegicus TaxID=10116 RepID=A6JYT4_RAT|nr:similar to RIKEN cDNA 0610037L13, isoform CRA_d [Rattus norvegicus]
MPGLATVLSPTNKAPVGAAVVCEGGLSSTSPQIRMNSGGLCFLILLCTGSSLHTA